MRLIFLTHVQHDIRQDIFLLLSVLFLRTQKWHHFVINVHFYDPIQYSRFTNININEAKARVALEERSCGKST